MDDHDFDSAESPYSNPPTGIEPKDIVMAIIGGLAGASIGGAIWFALASFAGLEIGWLAIGIGALAGMGAHKLSDRYGLIFQIIATVCALGVFFATKAAIVMYAAKKITGVWFDPSIIGLYQEAFIGSFGFFDILWVGLVGYSAWSQLSRD